MKKILALAIIASLVISTSAFANAVGIPGRFNQDQNVLIWTQVQGASPAGARDYATTLLTSSSILVVGSHRILGFQVTDTSGNAHAEAVAGLYDAAAVAGLVEEKALECEIEARDGETQTIFFPYPYVMVNGCVVSQGANTAVSVYYEAYGR